MLMRSPARREAPLRNPQRERQLWDDARRNARSLGCTTCPEVGICGGLHVAAPLFDCLTSCCGRPASCTKVCRRNPQDFVDRWREVRGFALDNVPRTLPLASPVLPPVAPILYHGNSRIRPAPLQAVALPLYRMFDRRDARPRFASPAGLRACFRVSDETAVVVTGTDQDPPIERWWKYGVERRRHVIRALRCAGVMLCTTPNYSLFLDTPRWDDLHSMKRIALVHAEFQAEGMAAALHVNGRTEADFERWAAFIAAREEITHIAYEFTTGTSWAGQQLRHGTWLVALGRHVGRPLHLVVRGGADVLSDLVATFAGITVLETMSFMKTMNRQYAIWNGPHRPDWSFAPTPEGAPLDALFDHNRAVMADWLGKLVAPRE